MEQLLLHLIGDYLTQSHWMAENKTKAFWPAYVHAQIYSAPFLLLTGFPFHSTRAWVAWWTILVTHFLIDRYRLARYVVWAKNHIAAPQLWKIPDVDDSGASVNKLWVAWWLFPPLRFCRFGYAPKTPTWLAVWLLIIADNTLHLTINYIALRWL